MPRERNEDAREALNDGAEILGITGYWRSITSPAEFELDVDSLACMAAPDNRDKALGSFFYEEFPSSCFVMD